MPFTIAIDRLPDHVRFTVSGPASLKNYFDLIDAAAEETQEHGDRLAVFDLLGVAGRLHLSDQMFIGEVVAQKLSHLRKCAIVVPQDPASYNSPKVANRKGMNLRALETGEEAVRWLREPGSTEA